MATHYFPDDQVHFTWDAGNEPVLTDRRRRHRRLRDARRQRQPDRAGLRHERHRRAGLGPRLPARRPGRASRARSPATRSPSRSSTSTRRAGAGRRSCPGSACWPTTSRTPYLRVFDLSDGRRTRTSRDDIAIPLDAVHGDDGRLPGRRQRAAGDAARHASAATWTRASSWRGTTLYLPVQVDGALFSTGDAHGCQGDGEVCVTGLEAPMYATLRFTLEKGRAIPAPQYRTAPGSLTPRGGPRRVVRHHRRRRRPVRRRAGRDAGDDRPHHATLRRSRARTPTCCARLCVDLKISEIVDAGAVHRQRAAAGGGVHRGVRRIVAMGGASLRPEDYDPRLERVRVVAGAERAAAGLLRRRRRAATRPSTWRASTARSPRTTTACPRTWGCSRGPSPTCGRSCWRRTSCGSAAATRPSLLAVWRAHGLDVVLREAWEAGVVLCGVSAGMNCWFEGSTTDSFDLVAARRAARRAGAAAGERVPALRRRGAAAAAVPAARWREGVLAPGYAADDAAALVFEGTSFVEVVSTNAGSGAYRVTPRVRSPWPPGCSDERRH